MPGDQRFYWEGACRRRCARHPVIEAFSRPKLEYVRRRMGGLDVATVVDVGAGNGYFTWLLDAWGRAIAVDFAKTMLRQHESPVRVQADCLRLPLADRSVDVAFCGNLLHHLADPEVAVSEMARVARRYVVLVEPNRNNPLMFAFGLWKPEERGTLRMNRGYLVGILERVGLRVVASTTMGAVLPNRTPLALLPLLRMIDGEGPLGFYAVALGEVT